MEILSAIALTSIWWGLTGLVFYIPCILITDMRGAPFDPDYFRDFDSEDLMCLFIVISSGPLALFILIAVIIFYIKDTREAGIDISDIEPVHGFSFVYACYWIANIGLRK